MNDKKLDLTKSHPAYYKAKQTPGIEEFEAYNYLSIMGQSAPDDPLFTTAIEAIYPVAYSIKFLSKANNLDFVVPKMEGQWWVEDERPFEQVPRKEWYWKILVRMPDFIDKEMYDQAKINLAIKGKKGRVNEVNFERINEGKCVQLLHIGSYEKEQESIAKIFEKMEKENLQMNGHHHEIYLSDPFRTPEWKLKTILRYPVK